jgi:hypothetical protein
MSSAQIRSEILDTGHPRLKSARIEVAAAPSTIFAILADPQRHRDFDGSRTITANISGPAKLTLGSKFGMKMHLGINYRITNIVVEYVENELIAWRHLGRWRWRYELEDIGNGTTRVTESFDARRVPLISRIWLRYRKAYPWTQISVAKTLVRLKEVAENEQS